MGFSFAAGSEVEASPAAAMPAPVGRVEKPPPRGHQGTRSLSTTGSYRCFRIRALLGI